MPLSAARPRGLTHHVATAQGLYEGRWDRPVAESVCSRVSPPVPDLPGPTTAGSCASRGRHFLGGAAVSPSLNWDDNGPVTPSGWHIPCAQQVCTASSWSSTHD